MKIHIEVETTDPDNMREATQVLQTLIDRAVAEKESPQKKTKIEDSKETKPDIATENITADDIRNKVSELIKAGKRTEVKAVLKQFGADTVTKLPKKDFENFMTAAALL